MISHKHKVIFIHIPRTGGTSIERMICGIDWWEENPNHKHISASTAKNIYSDWWDSYFKFSIVRNPWSRVVSMFRNPNYGREWSAVTGKSLDYFLENYEAPDWELSPGTACQYLDEEIDWIGRFENLNDDMMWLAKKLNLDYVDRSENGDIHCKCCYRPYHYNSTFKGPTGYKYDYWGDSVINKVAEIYKDDIERFGYKY